MTGCPWKNLPEDPACAGPALEQEGQWGLQLHGVHGPVLAAPSVWCPNVAVPMFLQAGPCSIIPFSCGKQG